MDPRTNEIRIVADAEELCRTAAEEFVSLAREAVKKRGLFAVALSGGSTPRRLYTMLANDPSFRTLAPWNQVHFFWGDERHVPPDHPDSNFRMAFEAMLSKVTVPPANIHRIKAENPDANEAAVEYEEKLHEFSQSVEWASLSFDLVLLGLGPDGHTASLFPGADALHVRERNVVATWVEKLDAYRITLTLPTLNNARCVVFIVSGVEKAEVLRAVLDGGQASERLPSTLVRPARGRLLWLVDSAAASLLPGPSGERL